MQEETYCVYSDVQEESRILYICISHAHLAFVKSNSYIKNIFVDSTLYICYVESTNRTLINEMIEYIYLSMHVLYIQCTE